MVDSSSTDSSRITDGPCFIQALDIDFQIISASEINENYRAFCEANYPGRFLHFFPSIQDQVAQQQGQKCEICKGSLAGDTFGCVPKNDLPHGRDVSLLFTGSPCDPFSQQRSKRWSDGVSVHSQFDLTMSSVVNLYTLYEPRAGVFEQVHGFTLPFNKGGGETPKQRQLVR